MHCAVYMPGQTCLKLRNFLRFRLVVGNNNYCNCCYDVALLILSVIWNFFTRVYTSKRTHESWSVPPFMHSTACQCALQTDHATSDTVCDSRPQIPYAMRCGVKAWIDYFCRATPLNVCTSHGRSIMLLPMYVRQKSVLFFIETTERTNFRHRATVGL